MSLDEIKKINICRASQVLLRDLKAHYFIKIFYKKNISKKNLSLLLSTLFKKLIDKTIITK